MHNELTRMRILYGQIIHVYRNARVMIVYMIFRLEITKYLIYKILYFDYITYYLN